MLACCDGEIKLYIFLWTATDKALYHFHVLLTTADGDLRKLASFYWRKPAMFTRSILLQVMP